MDLLPNMEDLVKAAAGFLPYVDFFLPNQEQAALMTGEADPAAARAPLAAGPQGVIVTVGEHGSLVATASGISRIPALST